MAFPQSPAKHYLSRLSDGRRAPCPVQCLRRGIGLATAKRDSFFRRQAQIELAGKAKTIIYGPAIKYRLRCWLCRHFELVQHITFTNIIFLMLEYIHGIKHLGLL